MAQLTKGDIDSNTVAITKGITAEDFILRDKAFLRTQHAYKPSAQLLIFRGGPHQDGPDLGTPLRALVSSDADLVSCSQHLWPASAAEETPAGFSFVDGPAHARMRSLRCS